MDTELRHDRRLLQSELERAGAVFQGKACRCPFHDDRHASAGVYEESGVWRFKCHACEVSGDIFDIRLRVSGEGFTRPKKEKPPRVYASLDELKGSISHLASTFTYTNPETHAHDLVILRVERPNEGKTFLQARPVEGGYILKAPEGKLPIYNRTRLRDANPVFIVEGEKCVHALHSAGHVATTSPGGALKSHLADWSPLKGKTCYLWPDYDDKGAEHMRQVQKILETQNCILHWLDPSSLGLEPKGDAFDYIKLVGGTFEEKRIAIELLKDEAQPLGASVEVWERVEEIISGRWKNIEWPWPGLTGQARALLPGTLTCVNGDAGSGKSFLVLESLWHWHCLGLKVCAYELEEDRTYHLMRALAQIAQDSNLNDDRWVKDNPDVAKEAVAFHADLLDSFGRVIWDAPDKEVSLKDLELWTADRCAEGYEIIAIDPITAAKVGEHRWREDSTFIFNAKTLVRKCGARLLLVTHPKAGKQAGEQLANMAGGASYQRFSQSVFWVKRLDKPRRGTVWRGNNRPNVTYDRTVKITKARNGAGAGSSIAFCFDTSTLRFSEQGVLVPDNTAQTIIEEEERDEKW